MTELSLRGVFAPTLTPICADLSIDLPAYTEFCHRLLEGGCHGLVLFGTNSEATSFSAGERMAAVDAVMSGTADNAFSLHRPPGHHAGREQAMGFCFFNHVAVAARHLRARHGIDRVAIVDWDVHHGNGTQDSFYEDGSVLYFSVHQEHHYPFTGRREETGLGEGEGTTLNVPLPPGAGDADYRRIFQQRLRPALEEYEPGFLLLSAGFDAHAAERVGGMYLTAEGFAGLTEECTALARDLCQGRLVSLLEGGYDLGATASSVVAHLRALSG